MRYIVASIIVLVISAAPVDVQAFPHWSFGIKGGYFYPDIEGWEDQYEKDGAYVGGIEVGFKFLRQLELNVDINYFEARGNAITASGRRSGDRTTFHNLPIYISLLYRFIFDEDQFVVPYLGGGYVHTFYWNQLNDRNISGDRMGFHGRCGLQLLIDAIDPESARTLSEGWGIDQTYLYFEGIYSRADDFGQEEPDLGGWGILTGLLIEF